MTLPADKIGDRGQRFVLQVFEVVDPPYFWRPVLYSHDTDGLAQVGATLIKRPSWTKWRIVDRMQDDCVVEQSR